MLSAATAGFHNQVLAQKALELRQSIEDKDWEAVAELATWMEDGPFTE